MTVWNWGAVAIAVVAGVGLAGWGLHRLAVLLEDRGYLYYRKSSPGSGNSANALLELDRLTRPSIEHVVVVQSSQTKVEKSTNDGD